MDPDPAEWLPMSPPPLENNADLGAWVDRYCPSNEKGDGDVDGDISTIPLDRLEELLEMGDGR